MKLRSALFALIAVSGISTAQAEKLTKDQFIYRLKGYSAIIKDANQKYEEAVAEDNKKEVVHQYCRRLDAYKKSHQMAKENLQFNEAQEINIYMADVIEQHLRPLKNKGITLKEWCSYESKL